MVRSNAALWQLLRMLGPASARDVEHTLGPTTAYDQMPCSTCLRH